MEKHTLASRAVVTLVVMASVAGCVATFQPQESAGGEGEFVAQVVSEAPPNATVVDYSNDSVQANQYLRKVVRKTINESGEGVVTVPEKDVEQTKSDLRSLPVYTPPESSDYEWGYYIRYDQTVVRVEFGVLE